ncbi:MAG TPA: MmcQ/YjbR family DNA-binding protein [Nocardioides sp.]
MARVRRGVTAEELREIVTGLPGVRLKDHGTWVGLGVGGKGFGYLSEDEESVLLKAHLDEREALVAQDPDTFEESFTAGQFGWVRIRLATVERDELVELVTEAWCQTAPRRLVNEHAEALALPADSVPRD